MSRLTGVETPGISLAREISMSRSAFSAGFKELVAVCKRRSREVGSRRSQRKAFMPPVREETKAIVSPLS